MNAETNKSKVLILGSFNADLVIRTPKFPQPGESLQGGPFQTGAGGKGSNQAVAAQKAGAQVVMIAKVGDDVFADLAYSTYGKVGIDTTHLCKDEAVSTGVALIEVEDDSGENSIVVALGANETITKSDVDSAENAFDEAKVFLTQLECNLDMVEYAMQKAHAKGLTVVLNPAPAKSVSDELLACVDYFTPNETEAEFYTGVKINTRDDMDRAAMILHEKGVKNVLITLGARGVYVNSETNNMIGVVPAFRAEKAVDTTGAGDAFNGAFCAAIAGGQTVKEAVRFGCATAAISVTRNGAAASMPELNEVLELLAKENF